MLVRLSLYYVLNIHPYTHRIVLIKEISLCNNGGQNIKLQLTKTQSVESSPKEYNYNATAPKAQGTRQKWGQRLQAPEAISSTTSEQNI